MWSRAGWAIGTLFGTAVNAVPRIAIGHLIECRLWEAACREAEAWLCFMANLGNPLTAPEADILRRGLFGERLLEHKRPARN